MVSFRGKKTKRAIGLSYDSNEDEAPAVSVKGENLQADIIVKIANRYGIPVIVKKELTEVLSAMKVDQKIPSQIFEAVAQIMVQIDRKLK